MLFDLRGRGRRRAVQAIYLSLAILMGGGLVLFGIGGATSGGLLDAFKGSANTQSASDIFQKRIDAAERGVRARPNDPVAWAQLTRVRYQQAGTGDGFDNNQNVFTDKGKEELLGVESAWNKYLTLTDKPDDSVASLMVQAFSQVGLNKPDKAVEAQEIILERRQTGPLYVQLAALAYQAGQTRKAQLASKKALALTPKDSKEQIKAQLESARIAASAQGGVDSSATPSTTTTPSS
jgi:tetratricopeptide (TPR) repeat protein